MEAMDLMDPRRRLQHNVQLMIGYVLVGIALLLLTIILLFVAYGFGLQNGRVVQSGLLYVASAPNTAQIYLDGVQYRSQTTAKILLDEGQYQLVLRREGYHDWQRSVSVVGGQIESYTYPLLFPLDLTTTTIHSYAAAPTLVSQSPDQRWLVVGRAGSLNTYDVYDLANAAQAPATIVLPAGLLTATQTKQRIAVVGWAADNVHLLLKHTYGAKVEYLLVNRAAPDQSKNVTTVLGLPLSNISLELDNGQQDQYLILDTHSSVLAHASLGAPLLVPILRGVLAFAANSSRDIGYVTVDPTDAHKVAVMVYNGTTSYVVRHDKAGGRYLLAITRYDGDDYLAVSAASENVAYIYKDPIDQINDPRLGVAVPAQAFAIKQPSYVAFSAAGQYVVFEHGQHFASYDAASGQGFVYTVGDTLDTPSTHASWMDEARLYYVSGGQVTVIDYDGQNRQPLVSADAAYPLAFDANYRFLYALVPAADGQPRELLTSTPLRTPADQ